MGTHPWERTVALATRSMTARRVAWLRSHRGTPAAATSCHSDLPVTHSCTSASWLSECSAHSQPTLDMRAGRADGGSIFRATWSEQPPPTQS